MKSNQIEMEKLEKLLKDIQYTLPVMKTLGSIDSSAFNVLDEAMSEALKMLNNLFAPSEQGE